LVPRIGLHALLEQLEIETGVAPDAPIHLGGPVEPQRGFVLHTPDWGGEDTLRIGDRWALSSTLEILKAIAAGNGPGRWLVALGYAGWGEGQLDEEMTRHGWFAMPATDALIFEGTPEERWNSAFAAAGIDVRLLAPTTGHA
jgi:putative transcriptional regulator